MEGFYIQNKKEMAITKTITIKADTKQAAKSFDDLGSVIQEQRDIAIEFEKELVELERELSNTSKTNLAGQKELKDRIIQLKEALKDQKVSIKDLNNEKTKEEKLNTVNTKSIKEQSGAVTGLTGVLDKFTGGAVSKISSFTKGLSGIATGFKGIGTAIAASGIGLLITIIAALVAAFKNTEAGQNKFAKLMGVIGVVVGNLVDILAGLGEALIDVFTKPQAAWDKFTGSLKSGYQFIKQQVIDRFSASWTILSSGIEAGILKMRIAWNKFTGDAEEANKLTLELKEVQKEIVDANQKIADANQAVGDVIVGAYTAAKNAVTGFIDEQKREIGISKQIADQLAKADKIDRALSVERAKADRDIADLRFKAEERLKYTAQERIKFLQDAAAIEEQITAKEIASAQIRLNAQKEKNKLAGSNKEDLDAEANLAAKVIQLDTARLDIKKRLQTQITSFSNEARAEAEARIKERQDEIAGFQKEIDERNKILGDKTKAETKAEKEKQDKILAIREEYKQKNQDFEDTTELEKIARDEEKALAELDALNATEAQKQEVISYYAQLTADETTRIAKEAAEKQKIFDENVAQSKVEIYTNTLNLIGNLAKQGSALAKGLAITEIVREQVKSISQTISATTVANAKAAAASPLTLGQPFVTLNTIAAGVGIAASATGAAKSIKDILSEKKSPSGGSVKGGGGSAPKAPSFNLVAGTGSNQIAEGLSREPVPLRAYVVSSEVTNAQSMDRNIQANASFG